MFSNRFDATLPSTIGTDQRFKRLKIDGVNVGVSVWDTAGQDRFQSLTPMYYRGAHGVWMDDFRQYGTHPEAVQMVVGNKIDLAACRSVSAEEGAAFARTHGCLYKETSAKADTGGVDEGVYDALVWGMVCTILDTPSLAKQAGSDSRGRGQQLVLGEGRRRHGGCCG
eukprot:gene7773-7971_t